MNLPEIFKNKIDIKKNDTYYRGTAENIESQDIFNKLPVKVYIETNKYKLNTTIVGKTKNYLVTLDKKVIYIKDITKIEKR